MSATLGQLRVSSKSPAAAALRAPRRCSAGRRAQHTLSVSASKSYRLTLLPGDGIGPEIMKVAVDCLNVVVRHSAPGRFRRLSPTACLAFCRPSARRSRLRSRGHA